MNAPVSWLNAVAESNTDGSLEIPLVDGGYRGEESAECVLQMITDLQSYHRRRVFSHQERFGVPDPLSEQALHDLARAQKRALQLIKQARGSNVALRLEPTLKVSVAAG